MDLQRNDRDVRRTQSPTARSAWGFALAFGLFALLGSQLALAQQAYEFPPNQDVNGWCIELTPSRPITIGYAAYDFATRCNTDADGQVRLTSTSSAQATEFSGFGTNIWVHQIRIHNDTASALTDVSLVLHEGRFGNTPVLETRPLGDVPALGFADLVVPGPLRADVTYIQVTYGVGTAAAVSSSRPILSSTAAAPTSVTATASDTTISVSFDAPGFTGDLPISNYEYSLDNGVSWIARSPADTSSPLVIADVPAGSYSVSLRAENELGAGAASSASAVTVTPNTVPAAPTGVTATAGNGQATVSWTAPTNDGGSAITGYVVTAAPGGATCTTTGATTCTVTGLTNGTAYTFTVTATNAEGSGAASAPSGAITPRAPQVNPQVSPAVIPAGSPWGLSLLALILAAFGATAIRWQRR